MKKRTDEEKREMIDKACDLFNEARENINSSEAEMKITIDCTEEQANLIVDALEDYFRLRMGQEDHMARSLASDTFTFDKKMNDYNKHFDKYITRTKSLAHVYQALIKIAYGGYSFKSSDVCRNACDIWHCLRYELYMTSDCEKNDWDVRGDKPIQIGTLDLPKIEVER